MLEKFLLAVTITFSLNLFLGSSFLTTSGATSASKETSVPAQLASLLPGQNLLQNLFHPRTPGS